ncbi:MAG: conjugal transfer protein TraD [Faecalibacterium sp.]|jgi:hypothetical protein|nr:conjugal transfer protein TraD [Faecalibacterium sp.]
MKLHFSRKTWYFLLLAAAALGMADGFAMLFSQDYSFLELFAFGACGLAALFLAAEKAPDAAEDAVRLKPHAAQKANPQSGIYFGCFVALLVSYILFGGHAAMRLTVFWPVFVLAEYRRGAKVQQQLRLLVFIEILQAAALLCVNAGLTGFGILATVFWILTCTARGWAALSLYKGRMEPAE